jgi:8-oxo-dGTP pyrophosphatase MutT (NUDIX family)
MKKLTPITAAGIIVFRNCNNVSPEILGLIALPKHRKRSRGKFDLPKGRIDEGESPLEAAFRECLEETGLVPKLIKKEPIVKGPLAMWIGEVSIDEDVVLSKNPYTSKCEHEGYEWLSQQDIKKNCLNYLRSFLVDSEEIIWESTRLWKSNQHR